MARVAIVKGDTAVLQIVVTRRDPTTQVVSPVNLTGASMRFSVKRATTDADASAVMRKGTTDTGLGGITITNAANGIAQITVSPGDTSALADQTSWLAYDVQLREADGRITTIAAGPFIVTPDVTITAT